MGNYPIYEFIADQGIEMMIKVIIYAAPNDNKKLVINLIKHWTRLAFRKADSKVNFITKNIVTDELLRFKINS